jgi:DNA-binding transcriptional LysR family regulator
MVDVQSLRYALTLAEELHFGRAAQAHFISAQPFGRRIQALERQLGYLLFSRTSRHVQLTPEGQRFLPRARRVLTELATLVDEVTAERSGGGLRIGVLGFGLADRWPAVRSLLAEHQALMPVDYVELSWTNQYDAVRDGEVDVAIVHDVGGADDLALEFVMGTERCAVVPVESDIAAAARLTSADLQGRPCVLPLGQPGLASWLDLDISGSPVTVHSPASIPGAVVASGALGVHGEPATRFLAHPGIRYIPLDGAPAVVAVATRADDRRPLVMAFRSMVRASHSLQAAVESGP